MDLEARKYNFIQELVGINNENILDSLERVLKREKEALQQVDLATKNILDQRLKSYKDNPEDVRAWKDIKADW